MSESQTENTANDENKPVFGYLAEFDSPGSLISAAEKIRDAGFTKWDCYSPYPLHGIDPAMGIKRTKLPWVVFIGGLVGLCGGLGLQWGTNAFDWDWISSGKPMFSLPANIPIIFECTVLIAGFAAFFGLWGFCKLPRYSHPFFKLDSFTKVTDNGFFLGVEAEDDEFDEEKTKELLTDAGATNVETAFVETDPKKTQMPKFILPAIAIITLFAAVPFILVANARASYSEKPQLHLIPDMDFQFKQKSQTRSDFFKDQRGSRANVPGTVYAGKLLKDDGSPMNQAEYLHYYYGLVEEEVKIPPATDSTDPTADEGEKKADEGEKKADEGEKKADEAVASSSSVEMIDKSRMEGLSHVGGTAFGGGGGPKAASSETKQSFALSFPSVINLKANAEKLMARGQERYNIYCAPCHGEAGYGNGLVQRRITMSSQDDSTDNDSVNWTSPANITDQSVARQPHGQLFYSISFGKGEMFGYSAQITEKDRWAITLYLRALQRRANASQSDLPKGQKPSTEQVID